LELINTPRSPKLVLDILVKINDPFKKLNPRHNISLLTIRDNTVKIIRSGIDTIVKSSENQSVEKCETLFNKLKQLRDNARRMY